MNVNEYIHAKDHSKGCTGCVQCMKSKLQHRIVNYKYPKTVGTRYQELYKGTKYKTNNQYVNVNNLLSKEETKDNQADFNYDMIRNKMRALNTEKNSEEK